MYWTSDAYEPVIRFGIPESLLKTFNNLKMKSPIFRQCTFLTRNISSRRIPINGN